MSNTELVNAFVDALLKAPDLTMQAIQIRLSATDYELRLLKADPCKTHHEKREPHGYQFNGELFPLHTGEKGGASQL